MAPVSKSKLKAKVKAQVLTNPYSALSGKDGNPSTPKEFDEAHPAVGELYFKADEDADAAKVKLVLLLNYAHQELHHVTERKIPVLTGDAAEHDLEIFHRATFSGHEIDVCVWFGGRDADGNKSCLAVIKLAGDGLDKDGEVFYADASWTIEAQKDKFTEKFGKMDTNYWAPRWKYIVNTLRGEMATRYDRNGTYNPPPQEAGEDDDELTEGKVSDSYEIIEEDYSVFAGSTGTIIGPKGENINKIRSVSGCVNIKMPERVEPRPKARELVSITLSGTARQIAKAKKSIQVHVDAWANAPRPARGERSSGGAVTGFGTGPPPPPPPPSSGQNFEDGNGAHDSAWEVNASYGTAAAWDVNASYGTAASSNGW